MTRKRRLALIALVAMGASSGPLPADTASTASPRFEVVSPCPFYSGSAVPQQRLTCGHLVVPERASHSNPMLRIPVVRIRSRSANARRDPVVFLHGGPGAAPLESPQTIERFDRHPFVNDRDIILFNQRGSAQTEPALQCEALSGGRFDAYADDLTLEERDERIAATAIRCLEKLSASGRDLGAYNAVEIARDLRAMRVALGIRRWNLLAVSYGTLVAIEAARIDARGVRSMLLDSLVPPGNELFMREGPENFAIGLDRLLENCNRDQACRRAAPNVSETLRELLEALDRQPLKIALNGPNGQPVDMVVNWHDLLNTIHWMLYNAETLRLVPLLIERTRAGDLRLLVSAMNNVFPAPAKGPMGTSPAFFAIVCRDQAPQRSLEAGKTYRGFSIVSFMAKVCDAHIPEAERVAVEPLRSAIPTLLLTGAFDPMTPDRYAREVAATLTRAKVMVVPNAGHSTLSDFAACQTQAARAFLDDLRVDRDAPCSSAIPPPEFIVDVEEALRRLGG